MTIEKLPSGSYRISESINGKRYRATVKHKPTKVEARELIQEQIISLRNGTPFGKAADAYIVAKQNILSPSTIRGYRVILNNLDSDFLLMPIDRITSPMLQVLISKYSANHKPKTVKNVNGFIVTVLKFYGADVKSASLPKRIRESAYIPTEDDVRRILAEAKGTKYEVPFILATLGLRRSEICALTKEDLKGNVLTINKAIVEDEHGNWEVKTTKTESSTREIVVPEYLAELIRERGIYDSSPHSIYSALKRYQNKLGIPNFSLHKMRHFFASYMHNQGYSDKQIQEFGGWKTDAIMKSVYQHAMDMDKIKESMSGEIGNLIAHELPTKISECDK